MELLSKEELVRVFRSVPEIVVLKTARWTRNCRCYLFIAVLMLLARLQVDHAAGFLEREHLAGPDFAFGELEVWFRLLG